MSHDVRTHVRTVNGRKVTVRQHSRDDDGRGPGDEPEEDPAAQRKRHQFEGRVLRERQQQEARYEANGKRTPGEKRRRKKNGWTRAKGHARKARRLYRRHKVKAAGHLTAAGVWAAAYGTRKAYRAARAKWQGRRS